MSVLSHGLEEWEPLTRAWLDHGVCAILLQHCPFYSNEVVPPTLNPKTLTLSPLVLVGCCLAPSKSAGGILAHRALKNVAALQMSEVWRSWYGCSWPFGQVQLNFCWTLGFWGC